ncbi:hypothetical protein HNQ68_001855 [Pseudochrobactrum saccharolyticum]|uniref:DUF3298 domain-containing protein n=1 Tax=Pseudochrobactrum saccharolyticum TaxID=354352 RepID=A0A7W8AK49_9HYPH|nr:TIR domain-containing protein [Pseudochrobactrum saccharolyticum]KAB0538088.1 DUF3298 domain-containing protein [Pseudochrobactrum saccharolyticum]MBB5091314.1 hypothetical protein [Pseudochrobactrum saccharolyticum]
MKIFLGYPNEHYNTAKEVAVYLATLGHEVWFDKEALVGGDDWDGERKSAQASADLIIHLCSREILERKGVVLREIKYTLLLNEDQPFGRLFAIFLKLDASSLPAELLKFHYIEYEKGNWRDELRKSIDKASLQRGHIKDIGKGVIIMNNEIVSFSAEIIEKTDRASYEGKYIQYSGSSAIWKLINSTIESDALGAYFSNRKFMEEDDINENPELRSFWEYSANEFFRKDEFVSLIVVASFHFQGAAHPNHYVKTFNFSENLGEITIQDVLRGNDETARKLFSLCEKKITEENEEIDTDAFLLSFPEHIKNDIESVWALLAQFSFNEAGITINFSPYDILPYAFGFQEARISWEELNQLSSGDFLPVLIGNN